MQLGAGVWPPPVNSTTTHSRSPISRLHVGCVAGAHPDQRTKDCPGSGVALNVTTSPSDKKTWHTVPHSIPPGLPVTVPSPSFATAIPEGCVGEDEPKATVARAPAKATTNAVMMRRT